jgi:hypothetical protein
MSMPLRKRRRHLRCHSPPLNLLVSMRSFQPPLTPSSDAALQAWLPVALIQGRIENEVLRNLEVGGWGDITLSCLVWEEGCGEGVKKWNVAGGNSCRFVWPPAGCRGCPDRGGNRCAAGPGQTLRCAAGPGQTLRCAGTGVQALHDPRLLRACTRRPVGRFFAPPPPLQALRQYAEAQYARQLRQGEEQRLQALQ